VAVKLRDVLAQAGGYLKEKGIESSFLDAEVLLTHVLGLNRAGLYREAERTLTGTQEKVFSELISRRGRREPVAYLTGSKEFMGLMFHVDRSVLIPRPETELLVEKALVTKGRFSVTLLQEEKGQGEGSVVSDGVEKASGLLAGEDRLLIVDVGTGSGAIAVSLAVFLPSAKIYATDCSPAALAVARRNAVACGVGERVMLYEGDLLEPLMSCPGLPGGVDLIAANLPYIPSGDLPALPPEVYLFEPRAALDGGADGLAQMRRLVPAAAGLLKPGGWLLMEIGADQGETAAALMPEPVWEVQVHKDLAGRDRLVVGRLKEKPL